MMNRRNLIVNLTKPRSKTDFTAVAILASLNAAGNGVHVLSSDLRDDVELSGGETDLIYDAMKALRNMGYAIECSKARHLSAWWLDPTPVESELGRQRRVREAYSTAVTSARQIAGALTANPGDPSLVGSHNHAVQSAIGLGTDAAVGMTIQAVVNDCVPL